MPSVIFCAFMMDDENVKNDFGHFGDMAHLNLHVGVRCTVLLEQ